MPSPLKKAVILCLALYCIPGFGMEAVSSGKVDITFPEADYAFTEEEKTYINNVIRQSEREVRALLPELPESIRVSVFPLARDVSNVGGVIGSADTPSSISIRISTSFDGGVVNASRTGLAAALYHEFHHLARGWTIADNKFGPGIKIAAVNEGLANVFSEIHTNKVFEGNAYPLNVSEWWKEVSALPASASYSEWMIQHSDGREAIGYKAGSFVIHQAMQRSGLSIVELSKKSVEDILNILD